MEHLNNCVNNIGYLQFLLFGEHYCLHSILLHAFRSGEIRNNFICICIRTHTHAFVKY